MQELQTEISGLVKRGEKHKNMLGLQARSYAFISFDLATCRDASEESQGSVT